MSSSQNKRTLDKLQDIHEGVDLKEALDLLRHAGCAVPTIENAQGTKLLQGVIDALCELSMHDGLTGLSNARYFRISLEREVQRATRSGETCALFMLDLDHFKKVNDQHGHLAGNAILQSVARILKENLRPMDTVARFGGEEFAMILPNSTSENAKKVAERIRETIAGTKISIHDKKAIRVTVSIGIACTLPGRQIEPRMLVSVADKNLYHAKELGRNCIWYEVPPPSALTGDEKSALFNNMRK